VSETRPAGGSWTAQPMLTAYVFDDESGEAVEDWAGSLASLSDDQVLWVDLLEPSDEEERAAREGFGLDPVATDAESGAPAPTLELGDDFIRVRAIAVSDEEQDPEREAVLVNCLIGPNWVLTVHAEKIAVLDDFRSLAEGGGGLGVLDAPSFLATLLEWVVTSYSRAFAEIETTLEEFDVGVLKSAKGETERQIAVLVKTRSRVGRLRRALSPHREIFATLAHSELDALSSDESAERFEKLTAQVDAALATARDAKDAVVSSFDVLILRTEHRTNEIMKILTLASILLLPGALIAGVLGMNINFKPSAFIQSAIFWIGTTAIAAIALMTLALARRRHWI
jgi:magnesium transporter